MAVRRILKYPNADLRRAALPVETFDDALKTLADDLLETMRTVQGLGITGPHIGVMQRVTVIQLEPDDPVKIYVNPQVIWSSEEMQSFKEGSISMPDVLEEIERPARVRVQYQDLAGAEHTEEADGLLSVCLQHEIDQLDGVYWIDGLSRLKRDKVLRRYEKMKRLSAG